MSLALEVAPAVGPRAAATPRSTGSVRVDGKLFSVGGERFPVRGVTYGTFRPRSDGARFPDSSTLRADLTTMGAAGFTVARTYTEPPADLLDAAEPAGLRVLAGIFYPDWRYLLGASRRQRRRVAREAADEVRAAARRLAGDERVFALCLGNEIPADVIRWYGTESIASLIAEQVEVVRGEDPGRLVTYGNYPTAEYLALPSLDFLTFNVFLEDPADLRAYLTRLHHLAGDRPLVLGEIGLHVAGGDVGERRQAEFIDAQLETVVERGVAGACLFSWTDEWWVGDAPVEGWRFGITDRDRTPRPALEVARRWNGRTVADLRERWPSMSVVICAYNAEETIDECLRHTCALDYPGLEVLVVDDGSTDRTAELAAAHPRARLVRIEHGGLSVARNEGFRAAGGEIVAYLDSDAYPTPEWPYYLALAFDQRDVGGAGGPNVAPDDDPLGAHVVAQSPGGPVHVLIGDDRAEHVPGCNMAFWKDVLEEVGGFDPIYTSAGDDVDLCWKVLDRRWSIGFHPAALVWHHRRAGLRRYLRQQRGYGHAEALVEARHPDRFSPVGTARWRGRIYTSLIPQVTRGRIYRGVYGTAAYQSVYQGGGHTLDLAHQVGVPAAAVGLATAPLAVVDPVLGLPALLSLLLVTVLAGIDVARARSPRRLGQATTAFRFRVAAHHLLQPLVRAWGRRRGQPIARRDLPRAPSLPGPVQQLADGTVVVPEDRPREQLVPQVVSLLRRRGLRAEAPSGWEDHDARFRLGPLVRGDLVTSSHPVGFVQLRIRLRPRRASLAVFAAATAGAAVLGWAAVAVALVAATAGSGARAWWTARSGLHEVLAAAHRPVAGGHPPARLDLTVAAPTATADPPRRTVPPEGGPAPDGLAVGGSDHRDRPEPIARTDALSGTGR